MFQDLLDGMKLEVLQHTPRSADLSPCDFHVCWSKSNKKSLKGRRFNSNAVVEFAKTGKNFTNRKSIEYLVHKTHGLMLMEIFF